MTIQCMETNQRMSSIVIDKSTIYLSGQVAEDSTKGIQVQTQTMLDNVDALLKDAGSDREHILSATIYIKSMDLFSEMNDVWDNWVPQGHAPARACVDASLAEEEYLVEISIVKAVKN